LGSKCFRQVYKAQVEKKQLVGAQADLCTTLQKVIISERTKQM
jgi:hypothetical protein